MPKVFPFTALRPIKDFEARVSAKSTDYGTIEELTESVRNNPYSYHRLTKPNLVHQGNSDQLMQLASRYLEDLKSRKILVEDEQPSMYLYRQTTPTLHTFTCLMAACLTDDYDHDIIKKHENTQVVREKQMASLFEQTGALGEGVLLSHNHHDSLKTVYASIKSAPADAVFNTPDGKHHEIWVISQSEIQQEISDILAEDAYFYIADGHHRSATMSRLNKMYPDGRFSKFMACLVDETQMLISPFYRWLSQVEVTDLDQILQKIGKNYRCFPLDKPYYHPDNKGEFGMYFKGQWYKLVPKHEPHFKNILDQLDVSLLERYILKPVFDIHDSKTDSRLAYKPADHNLREFVQKIDDGTYEIGFTLHAPEIGEVKEVSNLHLTMPPKSTFIEPKLRAGMIIMEF